MWLFTTLGFFSIVQKPGTTHLTVRARVKGDLEALRAEVLPELSESVANQGTDYPWRATVAHEAFAAALGELVRRIDYSNFKNTIAERQGHGRSERYSKVWSTLYTLQD